MCDKQLSMAGNIIVEIKTHVNPSLRGNLIWLENFILSNQRRRQFPFCDDFCCWRQKKLVFLLNYFCIFCCFSFFVTFRNFWLESLWKWLHDILPNATRPTVIWPNDNHFGQRSSFTLAAVPKHSLIGPLLMNAWLPVTMTSTGWKYFSTYFLLCYLLNAWRNRPEQLVPYSKNP